jgi:predicted transposase YdaD
MKKGRAEGLSAGREEERLANAKRMKADGVEPALIAKYTSLPVDEIKRL